MTPQQTSMRKEIISDLLMSIRKETRAAMLFVHTMSEITGIHSTDIKCLDYLSEFKFASVGELAKITGLTTGAMTAVIDRLEKAGFVRREADGHDRRKTIIRLILEHSNNFELTRNVFINQIPNNLSEYNDAELQLIANWNRKLSSIFHTEIEKILQKKHIT